eukprot:TRINITY_DN32548_c0_g1_i1.p1 TRINITY_DN32548_c0_g1~~TRINITY_DN32548_c0_g1_i1.p1  ORF type:complete len:762 (-),score=278.98 TRINITY_DN32548_c0_g1_i1:246-2531(-)
MKTFTFLLLLAAVTGVLCSTTANESAKLGADDGFVKTEWGEHQVLEVSKEKLPGYENFMNIEDILTEEGDIDPSALSSEKTPALTLDDIVRSRFVHPHDTYLMTHPGLPWGQAAEREFNSFGPADDGLLSDDSPNDSFQNEEDLGGMADYYMLKASGDIPTPVPLLYVSLGFQVESMMSQRSANVKRNSLRMMAQIGVKLKAAIFEAEVFVRCNLRLRSQGSRATLWNTIQTYANFVIMEKAMSIQSVFFKDTEKTPDRTLATKVDRASDAEKRQMNMAFLGLGADVLFPHLVRLGDEETALALQAKADAEWPSWDDVTGAVSSAYDSTTRAVSNAYHSTKRVVKKAYHHTKKVVKKAYHHTKKVIVDTSRAVADWTVARWNDLKAWAKSIRDRIYNFIKKAIQKLIASRVAWIKSKGCDLKITNTICLGGGAKASIGPVKGKLEAAWCPGFMATMRQQSPAKFSKNSFNGGNFVLEVGMGGFEVKVQAKVRTFFNARYKMEKFGDVDAKAWLLKFSILFPGSLGSRMLNVAALAHIMTSPAVKNIKQKIFGKLVCGEQRMPSQPTSYMKLVKDTIFHAIRSAGGLAAAKGLIPGFKKRAGLSVSLRFYVSRGKIHWDWKTSSIAVKLIGDTGDRDYGLPIKARGQMGISYRTAIDKNRLNPDMGIGCGLTKGNEGFKKSTPGRIIQHDTKEGESVNNLPPEEQQPGDGPCHKAEGWCISSAGSRCPSAAGVRSGLCTGSSSRKCCIRQSVMVAPNDGHAL